MRTDFFKEIAKNLALKQVGIQEFAESKDYCDKRLYPRQLLLLKLIFLEELTGKEEDVLTHWINGGHGGKEVIISPMIRERVEYLRGRGFPHFREMVLVGGRRSSKGFITGIAMAKRLYDTLQLHDPGLHYGIDQDKEIYFSCVASSQDQAKKFQYADLSSTVARCRAMNDYTTKIQELELSIATEADRQYLAQAGGVGKRIGRDISKLRGNALAANASTVRGSATMAICFDEMAWMLQEGESNQTAAAVYDAVLPSLAQFGKDAMIFCNPPEAPVWMGDLSFKPIGEVEIGDKVVGWSSTDVRPTKHLGETIVTNVMRRQAPVVKVTMESGRTFRCTPDHRWLTPSSGGKDGYYRQGNEWYVTPEVGRTLVHVVDPTPELPHHLRDDARWLAGIFDGEGSAQRGQCVSIAQSEKHNPEVCREIERVLCALGFSYTRTQEKYYLVRGDGTKTSKQAIVDFANWLDPIRKQGLRAKVLTGRWRRLDKVVSVEPDGFEEVVALTTTTGNYVCNGFASKNCNSSPYTKVGKFYERYEDGLRIIDGKPSSPFTFTFQFPSWALFEDWQIDPKKRFRKAITASPDWDPEDAKHSEDDRDSILLERDEERKDPDKYKVERRGQFAEVIDAFLRPEMVERAYEGRPTRDGGYITLRTNWDTPFWDYKYKAHLDPSSTTAGFGFALGHIEQFDDPNMQEEKDHVIFDIVHRWLPEEFPERVIDWEIVLQDIVHWIKIFQPFEITFDQFQSQAPIQWLNKWLREQNMTQIRVYEKVATAQHNWNRANVFRTALYQGLVHIPADSSAASWSALELKNLQQINTAGRFPRIDRQEIGPVQTKDIADCIMEVTDTLIGDTISSGVRESLGNMSPQFGAQGGFQIGGRDNRLDSFYSRNHGTHNFREMKRPTVAGPSTTTPAERVREQLSGLTAARSGSWRSRPGRGGGRSRGF